MLGAILKIIGSAVSKGATAVAKVAKKTGTTVKEKLKAVNPFKTPADFKQHVKDKLKDNLQSQRGATGGQDGSPVANLPSSYSRPTPDINTPLPAGNNSSSGNLSGGSESKYNEPTFKYSSHRAVTPYPKAETGLNTPTEPQPLAPLPFRQPLAEMSSPQTTTFASAGNNGVDAPYTTPTQTLSAPSVAGLNSSGRTSPGQTLPLLKPATTSSPSLIYNSPGQSSSVEHTYSNTTRQPEAKSRSTDIRTHSAFTH